MTAPGRALQQRRQTFGAPQTLDAAVVLAVQPRLARAERVGPGAGVRVDHPVALVLEVEVVDQVNQRGVLEHVTMVAGVEGVAVGEHGPTVPRPAAAQARARALKSSRRPTSRGPGRSSMASPAPTVPGTTTAR